MYQIPTKYKDSISHTFKKYTTIFTGYISKKLESKRYSKLALNDVLGDVLGVDKYAELITEDFHIFSKSAYKDFSKKQFSELNQAKSQNYSEVEMSEMNKYKSDASSYEQHNSLHENSEKSKEAA
jgi:hypothetical protein